ncbi:hypothetical protein [uncultured Bacteroides sp.]|uniref:hypothetical protein n=1 Tax=uncultured Bacteroides sp. TaxID=162156 RepID=UPI0025D3E5EF|nr:hypothetical protein [uncultured Bacteroides sp.]
MIQLPTEVLEKAICKAFEIGKKEKAIELGKEPKFISQRQAERTYGMGNVRRWLEMGIVKKYQDAGKSISRMRLSVMELEKAAYSINVTSNLSPLAQEEMCEILNQ